MVKAIVIALGLLVLIFGVVVAWAYARFNAAIERDIAQVVSSAARSGSVVTQAMIDGLPEPARRYFEASGVVGQAIPSIIHLRQKGRIRSSADARWMNLEAEEIYSTSPPAFVWRAWMPGRGVPVVMGRDIYRGGEGGILMKMLALVPVADEHGPELVAAGLMRYLNETMWFPAAFLGPNVTVAEDGPDTFRVTITDRGQTATAVLTVDALGRLTNFVARRYNTGSRSMETWETPVSGYGMRGGVSIPLRGSAVWKLPAGDLTYIELEITDIAYE